MTTARALEIVIAIGIVSVIIKQRERGKSMHYYAVLKKIGEDIQIVGIMTSHSATESEFPITKEEAKKLAPLVNDPELVVKVQKGYHDDFRWTAEKLPEITVAKNKAKITLRNHYVKIMNTVSLFEMYNVMMINNELAANGYFITNSNREEKYIDIINSGDEKLITLLQTYLEMKDRIDPMWEYYNKVKEFETNLDSFKTVEEVETSLNNLISYIN